MFQSGLLNVPINHFVKSNATHPVIEILHLCEVLMRLEYNKTWIEWNTKTNLFFRNKVLNM